VADVAGPEAAFRGVTVTEIVVAPRDNSQMTQTFTHIEHFIEERRKRGPVMVDDQRRLKNPNPVIRFNARAGLLITVIVGTMWCAYLFTALALVSAPSAFKTGDKITIVAWIAQTFLQLVLLPIIIVGQNIQAKASDKRAQATYDDADAVLHEALMIQKHLETQDAELERILQIVQAKPPG
jgi:hypothetical protein